jgi:hypothetical protein
MATAIPFVVRKESSDLTNLEALFYGFTGLLDERKMFIIKISKLNLLI